MLLAFFIFNAAEWAVWLAVLVYAFTIGGTTTAGVVALLQLIPAALVAPLGSVLGDRLRRDHALALGYATQSVVMGATVLYATLVILANLAADLVLPLIDPRRDA